MTFDRENFEKAKLLALKFVSTKMRTRQEVIDFLHKKNYDSDVIAETVAFLLEYRYLDDVAYCRAWIHDKIQFHPCGRKKMAAELNKKVSDRQLVQSALEEWYSEEQEVELALLAAKQKVNNTLGRKPITREQLARFLFGRGYSSSTIRRALQMMQDSETDCEFSM